MSYNMMTGMMSFSGALTSLKQGGRVRRSGWLPGVWLKLRGATEHISSGTQHRAYLFIRWADLSENPWTPSPSDLLQEDWEESLIPFGDKQ